MDDRVPRHPVEATLKYFQDHAGIFYRVAERKYNNGDTAGDLITISNADVVGEILPDIRRKIYVNPNQSAVLRYGDVTVDCPTLGEAVIAWQRLGASEKYAATIKGQDGGTYTGAEIDMLHAKTGVVSY